MNHKPAGWSMLTGKLTCLLVSVHCALSANAVIAGPQVHHIEATFPRCGQRGTTVEVILQGTFLKDPKEIAFFRPGIKAVEVSPLPPLPRQSLVHGGWLEDQVRCQFVIAPDCPLGEHPFRLRTATELTMVSTFWVTPFEVVTDPESGHGSNDTMATAMPVPRNVTMQARMDSGRQPDHDVYLIKGRQGEHLSVELTSVWLTEKYYAESEFDLMVSILDAQGRELARNDDSALHVQDPIVSVVLPADGDYFVDVRQRIYKGGHNTHYLAHIGTNLRPLAVFPAGGAKGQPLVASLLGDPAGEVKRTIPLPVMTGNYDYYENAPSPLPMRVSDYANVLEDRAADETRVPQLPSALNGIIETPGDVDAYRLSVKTGDRFRVRVFARSLGTPLDPRISIRPANSEQPEIEGDDASHADRDLIGVSNAFHRKDLLDPSVVWEPKQDGEYILAISDMRNAGDPTSVYRIEIEPTRDAIHTYLYAPVIDSAECPRLTTIAIPQGDRWTVTVMLGEAQGNRYKGELEITATGLPAGVQMFAPKVPAGQRSIPVQFIAASDTPPQTAMIELQAQPADHSHRIESGSHQAFPFLSHSGGRAWHTVIVDRYILAVTEPAPFTIELVPPQIPLSQSGELAMQVNLKRRPGFNEAVDYQFDWSPPGVQAQPTVTIPEGESFSILRLFASPSAQPGTWKIAATATTTGGSYYLGTGRQRNSTAFVDLTIAEPYVALKNRPSAVRRGDKSQIVWDVEHKKPFPGTADAVLLGLPRGVTIVEPAPQIKAGDKQLVFEVWATDDALLGQYKELTCEIIVRQAGQEIRQRTGKGILRVDPAAQ
jgi:hypothetical protein